jgi:outer membrane lipoprotein SlyB
LNIIEWKMNYNDKILSVMKSILTGCFLLVATFGYAQTPPTEPHTSFAKSLGIYVFPAKNQDQATQDKDDADCYRWAVEQSGVDPINPPKVEAEQVDTSVDGTAVRGAARGAAAGVAIGAIAGDAGKGAAIGAVAGGLAGRRAKVAHDAQEQEHNNQAAQQQQTAMTDSFKKAFTVCLEGKGYTVK